VGCHRHDKAVLPPGKAPCTYGTGGQPRVCPEGYVGMVTGVRGCPEGGLLLTHTNNLYHESCGR
jgi:hypothetical protein